MQISFSPQRSDKQLTLSKQGNVLIVGGDPLDFTDLPDGGEYPSEAIHNEFVVGGVKRLDGEIHITVMLPYSNSDAPTSVTFPEPIQIIMDGDIELPEGSTSESEDAY